MQHTTTYDDGIPFEAYAAEFARLVGGHRWVVARRTRNIVLRYGSDVVCLSRQKYTELRRVARLNLTQGYD